MTPSAEIFTSVYLAMTVGVRRQQGRGLTRAEVTRLPSNKKPSNGAGVSPAGGQDARPTQ
jgi:hypothetical protein